MTHVSAISSNVKDEATAARSAKAKSYARKLRFLLFVLVLTAIWQDKRLAPPVHDGMQLIAGKAMAYVEENEALSEMLSTAVANYHTFTSDG